MKRFTAKEARKLSDERNVLLWHAQQLGKVYKSIKENSRGGERCITVLRSRLNEYARLQLICDGYTISPSESPTMVVISW